jgi:hypothetical protein
MEEVTVTYKIFGHYEPECSSDFRVVAESEVLPRLALVGGEEITVSRNGPETAKPYTYRVGSRPGPAAASTQAAEELVD